MSPPKEKGRQKRTLKTKGTYFCLNGFDYSVTCLPSPWKNLGTISRALQLNTVQRNVQKQGWTLKNNELGSVT